MTQRGTSEYFGRRAGDPAKGYYSFDLAGWHVVALNSNCAQVGGCGRGLTRRSAGCGPTSPLIRRACTLAYWHHPRFSSGEHGSDPTYAAFWQALYDANADVVLVGHDHDYERFAPQRADGVRDRARGHPRVRRRNRRQEPSHVPHGAARTARRATSSSLRRPRADARTRTRTRGASGRRSASFTDAGSARCH